MNREEELTRKFESIKGCTRSFFDNEEWNECHHFIQGYILREKEQKDGAVDLLESIKKDYLEKFDNDPHIARVANVIINEFKLRTL